MKKLQAADAFGIVYSMRTSWHHCGVAVLLFLGATLPGCQSESTPSQSDASPSSSATERRTLTQGEVKRVPVDKKGNVILEVQGDRRRVLIQAEVCLREGQLEQLLCRKQSKEHEAILAADVDARSIHLALETAGAKAGKPVKYDPVYEPATGERIKVTLEYEQRGRKTTVPAKDWILNLKTKKTLEADWVFAGSQLVPDPFDKTKPPYYLANDGDLICVSNFPSAMLDLPIASSKDNADLVFVANTAKIPALETKVLVILEPLAAGQK